jgi:sugar lactone lactonase YvrE
MIQNRSVSSNITAGTPTAILASLSTVYKFTQMIIHPSGWAYLYCDSNVSNATASNYIYSYNIASTTLSNLSYGITVHHMALDPLGNVFISHGTSSNITKYRVNTSTGVLTSNYTWVAPFSNGRVFATTGYVYVYLPGTQSNIYQYFNYSNSSSTQFTSAVYSNETLSSFSVNPNDTVFYATTSSSNVYSYSVRTGTTTRIAALSAVAHTPFVDAYTNTLYTSLTASNSVTKIPLDGTASNLTNLSISILLSASFSSPTAVLYGTSGDVYVCSGNAVRKIASGNVTTLSTSFSNPSALCINTAGTILYIADTGNNDIKQLVLANLNVTTFASGLSSPQGICCDATNLYVADTGIHVIKQYVISSADMTIIAGSNGTAGSTDGTGSTARFNSPRGLAIGSNSTSDPIYLTGFGIGSYSTIYIADYSNHVVRVLNPATSNVLLYSGITGTPGNSQYFFRNPSSIVLYSNYPIISDTGNNNIKAVSLFILGITQSTISPNLTNMQNASGTAILNNILYISSKEGSKLITYNLVSKSQTETALPGFCDGVCVDFNSNAYCIARNQGIYRVTNGGVVTLVASGFVYSQGICVDPSATYLYLAQYSSNCVTRITIADGSTVLFAGNGTAAFQDGVGTAARFNAPSAICIDTLGSNLYVSDLNNNRIRRVNIATSNVTTFAQLESPRGIVYAISGRIFATSLFASSGKFYIYHFSTVNLPYIQNFAGGYHEVTSDSQGMCIDPSETIYNAFNSFVYVYTFSRTYPSYTIAGDQYSAIGTAGYVDGDATYTARFNIPQGLSFQASSILIADTGNFRIRQLDLSSNVTTYAGTSTNANIDGAISGTTTTFTTPQTLSLYSNSLYTMMNSNTTSSIVQIPLNYPPTTFTFSAPVQGQQIQNTTGRALTIAVSGSTVTNPTLNSIPGISDIKTLNGTGPYTLV